MRVPCMASWLPRLCMFCGIVGYRVGCRLIHLMSGLAGVMQDIVDEYRLLAKQIHTIASHV